MELTPRAKMMNTQSMMLFYQMMIKDTFLSPLYTTFKGGGGGGNQGKYRIPGNLLAFCIGN